MYTFISMKIVGDINDEICIHSTQEKFKDTKRVIRSHKSKKNRQYNDQNKKTRRQNTTQKTSDQATQTPLKTGGEFMCCGGVRSSSTTNNTSRGTV